MHSLSKCTFCYFFYYGPKGGALMELVLIKLKLFVLAGLYRLLNHQRYKTEETRDLDDVAQDATSSF
ncbi:hypothetical protein RclHR1_09440007 [Rhizophagus clarus]|uniref:Uncharacterized protein n=1 Tax=Rhizophagus clarus TaxID=94130 RepID=A0A2Z6SII4_9GLOM|nr:hypothetical protein RclHR1_09440007 [Rhizophagus clarus]